MMVWICLFFFILSLATTRLFCGKMLFNPLVVFFGVWLVNFSIYSLDTTLEIFYPAQADPFATLLFIFSFAFFYMGAVVALAHPKNTNQFPYAAKPRVSKQQLGRAYWITKVLFFIFAAGVLWKYQIASSAYGSVFDNIATLREAAWSGDLVFPLPVRLMTLFGYFVVLNLGVLFVFRSRWKYFFLMLAVILFNWVNDATIGMRGSTFNAVLLSVTVVPLAAGARWRTIGVKDLILGACATLAGLVLITSILFLRSDQTRTFGERLILDNYVYFVGSIPATYYFIGDPWPTDLPGQWTFAGIYQLADLLLAKPLGASLFSLESWQTFYAPITDQGPFNVASYLIYFYSDLGTLGIILFSAGFGFASTYLFLRTRLCGKIVDVQMAALVMVMVLFSIRGIMTNGVAFWVTALLVAWQGILIGSSGPHPGKLFTVSKLKSTSAR